MSGGRVVLTKEGYLKMEKELDFLKGPKRREILQALTDARAQGDLSENAEYDAAKEAQAHNERRINEMEEVLSRVHVIDCTEGPCDQALLGTTISIVDCETDEEIDYKLVSEQESDFDQNKISSSSPVGKAILGHRVGDIVEIKVPMGVLKYKIKNISR
jgi:transcription elongation factor GreA